MRIDQVNGVTGRVDACFELLKRRTFGFQAIDLDLQARLRHANPDRSGGAFVGFAIDRHSFEHVALNARRAGTHQHGLQSTFTAGRRSGRNRLIRQANSAPSKGASSKVLAAGFA